MKVMDDIRQFVKTESESLKESVERATSKYRKGHFDSQVTCLKIK